MDSTIDLLRQLLASGISQSEIQRRTGIPQPRLSKWARGKVPSGADDALKLKALADELSGIPATTSGQVSEARHAA